jgi:hypothetical protein
MKKREPTLGMHTIQGEDIIEREIHCRVIFGKLRFLSLFICFQ